jgi:hypothetical protein
MSIQTIEQFSLKAAPLRALSAAAYFPPSIQSRQAEDRNAAWEKAIRKIRAMMALRDDWDGLGASAPSSAIVFHAMRLARRKLETPSYPAPTRVVATPSGTIGLEWQQGSVYTEAEIVGSNQSDWVQILPGGGTRHWCEYLPEESTEGQGLSPPDALPQVYWANPLR